MFNNYFGKTVQYEEIYVDENNNVKYKEPITISGTFNKVSSVSNRGSTSTWLHNKMYAYKRMYRLPFQVQFGSKIDGAKVIDCIRVGFGSRIDFWYATAIKYEDILVTESDLSLSCTIERKIGLDNLRNPIYSEPEVIKTWYFEDRDIYKPNANGIITAHPARGYIFIPSVELKLGDKIDGYIIEEINNIPSIDGGVNHIEAYICVSKGAMHLNSE